MNVVRLFEIFSVVIFKVLDYKIEGKFSKKAEKYVQ